jgi:hypothetical protein
MFKRGYVKRNFASKMPELGEKEGRGMEAG